MVGIKLKDLKNWTPEVEAQITEKWKMAEMFRISSKDEKEVYSIDTPPPYVNKPVHIAQSVTYCYMDFFARYQRMKGKGVLFPLGLDRNGLPIEMAAEKKFGESPFVVGREKFLENCKSIIDEGSDGTVDIFSRLGISFTSYKEGKHLGAVYKTDAPEYRSVTQATVIELYKKGLIYEDKRINNWDPKLRTTIADSEIEYKEVGSMFNDVRWKVAGGKEEIVIATTRPELIGTCSAVIYHPDDKRYKKLKGKNAVIPIYGREVPIMPHPFANPEKGTGIVMMCAGGDLTDIQFVREQKLEPIIWVGQDGRMIGDSGVLSGLKVREAREKIIELLKESGELVKQEKITHRTPISERSGAEVEFVEMPEFYLKQVEFKDDMRKISSEVNFYPDSAKKLLDDWIDSVSIDWPISRRRFYATPIPLWHGWGAEGPLVAVPKAGKYYTPWKEKVPKDAEVYQNGEAIGVVSEFLDVEWRGEERVLDTWMDSSISELILLQYGKDDEFFEKSYPASLRPQGKEIVRTWLYYTLLRGYLETEKPAFEDVWVHQHLLGGDGRKMSKSLGNVVDPINLLNEHGAEAIRFWSATEGNLAKQDLRVAVERIAGEKKSLNKLLNVSKFVSLFDRPKDKPELLPLDELFVDYVEFLTQLADDNYAVYDFHSPAQVLRDMLWETFSSHYIEMVKSRAYNEKKEFSEDESAAARWSLHYILERMLVLLYPIIPQITSVLLEERGIKPHEMEFPTAVQGKSEIALIDLVKKFNSKVWKMKKEKGISLREGIEGVKIPAKLKKFEKDLKSCHRI